MTIPRPAFHFSTVVFGEPYTTWFLEAALPSELSPGNLPAMLSGSGPCRYHVYTSSSDQAVIQAHPAVHRLQQLLEVEYHLLDETLTFFRQKRLNQYDIMGQAYSDTGRRALADGALVVPLWADGIFSNGSFSRLLELAQRGFKVVAIFGNQASAASFVPAVRRAHFNPGQQCITATGRELNALYLENISPNWQDHYLDSGCFPDYHPALFAWKVGDEGALVRSMVFHPLLAAPRADGTFTPTLGTGTDATQYFSDVCTDFEKEIYVVTDTDDICFVSLNQLARIGHQKRPPNTVRMAVSMTRRMWPHTRFFLEQKLRFHTSGSDSAKWKSVEAESDRFFANLLTQVDFFERHGELYADTLRLAPPDHPTYADLINNEFLVPRINDLVEGWRNKKSRVVVYGAGSHTVDIGTYTNLNHANIVGLADGDAALHGKEIMGYTIVSPAEIPGLQPDVVLISSAGSQEEIYGELRFLERLGIQLVRLYYHGATAT